MFQQLIEQVGHEHSLIIVLLCSKRLPAVQMLHSIAIVFLLIKPFVFYFPSKSSGTAELLYRLFIYSKIGNAYKVCRCCFFIADGFFALQIVQAMFLVQQIFYPVKLLGNGSVFHRTDRMMNKAVVTSWRVIFKAIL